MKPWRSVLSPALIRCDAADERERRSVLVRVRFSAGPQQVAAGLSGLGAESESPPGHAAPERGGTVTCTVTPPVLRRLADQPWVQAIDEPRRLDLRGLPQGPDASG